MAAYLQIEGIRHVFGGGVPGAQRVLAIDGVTLEVKQGEFVSLLGPSGCGKTTLLRMIDGLIKPTRGHIFVDGKRVEGPGPDRAMVFQDFGLLPWRTAIENVEMGLEFQGRPKKERREIARQMLKVVELEHFEKSYPHQLSGGMRQRVGLARALSINPQMFLMDEPFGALDAQTRELMQEELLRIWHQFTRTVVFVTHSIDEAIYLSDRVIIMTCRPGRVLLEMDVPLPKPRWEGNLRASPEFGALRQRAWNILREEIRGSKAKESESYASGD
ncbi:MAG: ABC transporter ATP-binding protein [Dehalococcoidia bacterium]|nr:ABC transporter ATP-binding protein [Dehalococcoidia bacterium]